VKSQFWDDAQSLNGRENATSVKCEGRFYMMKIAAAKKTARNFWQPKPPQKQLSKTQQSH